MTVAWTLDGERRFTSDPRAAIAFTRTEGLVRTVVAGEAWVVRTRVFGHGVFQAAQRISARREMAAESALRILLTMLALLLITAALLVVALRRGLRPLDVSARAVAARSESSLEPVPTDAVPREILPLVSAVNGLLRRLDTALAAQREFLADAAHELRSPATALRLQLQLLERSTDDATRTAALRELKAGVDRSQRLIEQLLQVARSGTDGEPMRRAAVDLGALARAVVARLSVNADAGGIDLGADAPDGVVADGDADQLTVLMNNLVENALRYTPAGGTVDVGVGRIDGRPVLRVSDDGPGIPEGDRARVFERFHRGTQTVPAAPGSVGSGLGLAIVQAIAERHGARVSLHTASTGHGLEVRVVFAPPPIIA